MLKNRLFQDIVVGGSLGLALLLVFLLDRLISPPAPEVPADTKVVRKGGTLLGDDEMVVHIKALGSQERLEKLKVVKLHAKVSFAKAANVNDMNLMWCWEPAIVMRFSEVFPEAMLRKITDELDRAGPGAEDMILRDFKSRLELDERLGREVDDEARKLIRARDYRPFFGSVLSLEGKDVYLVFNDRMSLPLKQTRAAQLRNLLFALSVSNLIPIRRHKFHVEPAAKQTVRGRMCDQFLVNDPSGLKLQFYFDQETHLLCKIAHMGHDPEVGAPDREVLWEHYFTDYRETSGIKQWRKAEIDTEGRRFATLDVDSVDFFDEMRPEMLRPGSPAAAAAATGSTIYWIIGIVVGVGVLGLGLVVVIVGMRGKRRRARRRRYD